MNKRTGIYKIENQQDKKCYIGSAVDVYGRKRTHFSSLSKNKHHSIYLQRAYNKYGKENFVFEIIEFCEKEKLIEREQYYLDMLNPEYNICKIAGNCLGIKGSKESNLKKSLNHSMRGKFGKEHNSTKIVYQYSLDGNFIREWGGAAEIERELGFNAGNIRKSIKNNWTLYNFYWAYNYLGIVYNNIPKRRCRDKTKKKILQYDLDGNFIKEWGSIKEADVAFGRRNSYIIHALKGNTKTIYGYVWKYKENI